MGEKGDTAKMDVDDVIEHIGIGKFQYKLAVYCGVGVGSDSLEYFHLTHFMPFLIFICLK